MIEVEIITILKDLFGVFAPAAVILYFGYKELRRQEEKSDDLLHAMQQQYLVLIRDMLSHVQETNSIMSALEKKTVDNTKVQQLVIDVFAQRLEKEVNLDD